MGAKPLGIFFVFYVVDVARKGAHHGGDISASDITDCAVLSPVDGQRTVGMGHTHETYVTSAYVQEMINGVTRAVRSVPRVCFGQPVFAVLLPSVRHTDIMSPPKVLEGVLQWKRALFLVEKCNIIQGERTAFTGGAEFKRVNAGLGRRLAPFASAVAPL